VLAQICREYITATAEMMQEQVDDRELPKRERSSFKRKRKVAEAFGEEFDARCFELVSNFPRI
jgi:hypothetical protein